jgi:hypothetical protein
MMSHALIRSTLVAAAFAAVPAAYGAETILLQDDFESYADTAAMNAVWNANPGNTSTLNTSLPGPTEGSFTKSLNNTPTAGSQHAARTITTTSPSDEVPILWQFDYFWDGTGNKRMTGGLRNPTIDNDGDGILEMGFYNSAYNPINPSAPVSGFAVRTTVMPGAGQLPEGVPGGLNGWRIFTTPDNTAVVTPVANTWNTFSALIKSNSVEYSVDIGRDGTIDGIYTAQSPTDTPLDLTGVDFDTVRLGTGLTSGGGGADFDNVLVKTVPAVTAVPGDADGDGDADLDDIGIWATNFTGSLAPGSGTGTLGTGDFDGDKDVDLDDQGIWASNFTGSLAPGGVATAALAAVPEPASLSLLALGAIATLARRRR